MRFVLALFTFMAGVQACSSAPTRTVPDLCPKYVMTVFDQDERVSSTSFVFEQVHDFMWMLRSGNTSNTSGLDEPWIEKLWMYKKGIEGSYQVSKLSQGRTVHLTLIDWDEMFPNGVISRKKVRLTGGLDGHAFVGSMFLETESGSVRVGKFVATCDTEH